MRNDYNESTFTDRQKSRLKYMVIGAVILLIGMMMAYYVGARVKIGEMSGTVNDYMDKNAELQETVEYQFEAINNLSIEKELSDAHYENLKNQTLRLLDAINTKLPQECWGYLMEGG